MEQTAEIFTIYVNVLSSARISSRVFHSFSVRKGNAGIPCGRFNFISSGKSFLKAMLDWSRDVHIFGHPYLLIGFTDLKILLHN
jgi:hypothetical protein